MTDVVWVALISAGAALVTALATQYLATRAASKQADRADKREALQWQRTEALRREELQHQGAQRALEQRRADLEAVWAHALQARARLADLLDSGRWVRSSPLGESATGAAAAAYAVALVGLPGVRSAAKVFYEATAKLEGAGEDDARVMNASKSWGAAFKVLEETVARLAE